MKNLLLLMILLCALKGTTQITGVDYSTSQIQQINTDSSANEGDLYRDTSLNKWYIGTTYGTLRFISEFEVRKVSNELCFKDDNYYYVSLKIGVNGYKVIRYDRSDVNIEQTSVGSGTQPSTLTAVQGLIYI